MVSLVKLQVDIDGTFITSKTPCNVCVAVFEAISLLKLLVDIDGTVSLVKLQVDIDGAVSLVTLLEDIDGAVFTSKTFCGIFTGRFHY